MDKIHAMLLLGDSVLADEDFNQIQSEVLDPQAADLQNQFTTLSTNLNAAIEGSYDHSFDPNLLNNKIDEAEDLRKKVETTKQEWDTAAENEEKALDDAKKHQTLVSPSMHDGEVAKSEGLGRSIVLGGVQRHFHGKSRPIFDKMDHLKFVERFDTTGKKRLRMRKEQIQDRIQHNFQ